MTTTLRIQLSALATLLALSLSLLYALPVRADESIPPPDAEAAATEEVAASDASETQIFESSPQAPASPGVTTAESDSSSVPSEESFPLVTGVDPMWCPSGVTPGGAGCSISYASLSALVASFVPAGPGAIWIQSGFDTGASVTINGLGTWSAAKFFSLTLRGGWNGVSGSSTTDPLNPSIFNGDSLYILAWEADVILTDIVIQNTASTGLIIGTTKNISLTRVRVNNNAGGNGAYLDNSSGTGSISVTSSEFNANAVTGLDIASSGLVTLKEVMASVNGLGGFGRGADIDNTAGTAGVTLLSVNVFNDNDDGGLYVLTDGAIKTGKLVAMGNTNGYGAYLKNDTAATAQPVTIAGPAEFKYNQHGLVVESNGAISMANLTASLNYGSGAELYNNMAGFASNVTLSGTNRFERNSAGGLLVRSLGSITLNNISANLNGHPVVPAIGADISNAVAATPKPISLTGVNHFDGNYGGGVVIVSKGAVMLSNVTASSNGDEGMFVANAFGLPAAPQNVTLAGTNRFDGNATDGLIVHSFGSVSVSSLSASHNGSSSSHHGALLDNTFGTLPRPVTLSGINRVEDNAGTGLEISSKGAIKVNSLTALLNGNSGSGHGASLANTSASGAQAVTFTGVNTFSDNDELGLLVLSRGAITISTIAAAGNDGGAGVSLDSTSSGTASPQNVTISTKGTFSDNHNRGLVVAAYGNVTLNNITATGNGTVASNGYGVLVNNIGSAAKPVVFGGTSSFSDNYLAGLHVTSKGPITLNNISALSNGAGNDLGVVLQNNIPGATGGVTIAGSLNTISGSFNGGLLVQTNGPIKLSNMRVEGNGLGANSGNGAFLNNAASGSPRALTITGMNVFSANWQDGLLALISGPITASNLIAAGNLHGRGALLQNTVLGDTLPQNVTLAGSNAFEGNASHGLYITTFGAVTASNLHGESNGQPTGSGAVIDNAGGASLNPVTLTGFNVFTGNSSNGLHVSSKGAIALSNVSAFGNGTFGVYLDNSAGSGAGITLTGGNLVVTSGDIGLNLSSRGPISVGNLTAQFNGSHGAVLDNSSALTAQKITLSGINDLSANFARGLYLLSAGPISISNLTASRNAAFGAVIYNLASTPAFPQPVSLTGYARFENNAWTGLQVNSYGAISVANLTAVENGTGGLGGGALLDNLSAALSPRKIALTGRQFVSGNGTGGIEAYSLGPISVSDLTATNNTGTGAYLYNDDGAAAGGITVSGTNTLSGNTGYGLDARSRGPVMLSNVSASLNGFAGVDLQNSSATSAQNIVLSGVNVANGNGFDGVFLSSNGLITVNSLTASDNGGAGLYVNNDYLGFTGGITLTGTNRFMRNAANGVEIWSNGLVTLSNITGDDNAQSGILVTTNGSLTVACGSFNTNGTFGIRLFASSGTLTLKGVFTAANTSGNEQLSYTTLVRTLACP